MRQYAILKTIEHFEQLLQQETLEERKASLRKLIELEYEKLHSEPDFETNTRKDAETVRTVAGTAKSDKIDE
jgi:hypothetical protein